MEHFCLILRGCFCTSASCVYLSMVVLSALLEHFLKGTCFVVFVFPVLNPEVVNGLKICALDLS